MKPIMITAALLALTACATVTKDSEQEISVVTTPAEAQCVLHNNAGSWNIATTPGKAVVKRNFSPLVINCTHHEHTGSATLEARTRGRAYGNILLGGVPALIDDRTGAGYEYKPASATIELK